MSVKRCTLKDLLTAAQNADLAYKLDFTKQDLDDKGIPYLTEENRCLTTSRYNAAFLSGFNFGTDVVTDSGEVWEIDSSVEIVNAIGEYRLLALSDFAISAPVTDINPVIEVSYSRAVNYNSKVPSIRYLSYAPEEFSMGNTTNVTLEDRNLSIIGKYSQVSFTPRFYTGGLEYPVTNLQIASSTLNTGADARINNGQLQILSINSAGGAEGALIAGINTVTITWTCVSGAMTTNITQTIVLTISTNNNPTSWVNQGPAYVTTEITGGSGTVSSQQLTINNYLILPGVAISHNGGTNYLYSNINLTNDIPYRESGGSQEFPVTIQGTVTGISTDVYRGAFVDFIGPYVEGIPMTDRGSNAWGIANIYPNSSTFFNYLSGGDSEERNYEYYAIRRTITTSYN